MRLLLLGATGLVGMAALKQALAKDAISGVVAPTRRPLVPQNKLAILPKKFHVNPAPVIAASLLDSVLAARPGCRWIFAEELN
jgi:uncharacterized protein YbjT (DUF2867 family)